MRIEEEKRGEAGSMNFIEPVSLDYTRLLLGEKQEVGVLSRGKP